MILVSKRWVKILTFGFATAIALYPFILVENENIRENSIVINHEKIHLRQQIELLLIFFYLIYAIEYLVGRINGKNHFDAYRNISFEKEAYANEENLHYLKEKPLFSFANYWGKSN